MVQLTTISVGTAGEQLAALEFTRRGIEVYKASGPYRADMVAWIGGRGYRVQVKTAEETGDKARFFFRSSKNRPYTDEDVDLFALVSLASNRVLLVPFSEAEGRLTKTVDFSGEDSEWDFDKVFMALLEGGSR